LRGKNGRREGTIQKAPRESVAGGYHAGIRRWGTVTRSEPPRHEKSTHSQKLGGGGRGGLPYQTCCPRSFSCQYLWYTVIRGEREKIHPRALESGSEGKKRLQRGERRSTQPSSVQRFKTGQGEKENKAHCKRGDVRASGRSRGGGPKAEDVAGAKGNGRAQSKKVGTSRGRPRKASRKLRAAAAKGKNPHVKKKKTGADRQSCERGGVLAEKHRCAKPRMRRWKKNRNTLETQLKNLETLQQAFVQGRAKAQKGGQSIASKIKVRKSRRTERGGG